MAEPGAPAYRTDRLEGYSGPTPSGGGYKNFRNLAETQADEDAFEFQRFVTNEKPYGFVACAGHMIKGALGAGILSCHCSYKYAGVIPSLAILSLGGFFYGFCMMMLVQSAHKLYKRTRTTTMSYPDLGESSCSTHTSATIRKLARPFRHWIDIFISIDLYGSCACYQLIIAKTIKQLVEKTQKTSKYPTPPYTWGLRHYLAALIVPIILICLIRHLKYLAPFALVANAVIAVCVCFTIYYSMKRNPGFKGLKMAGTIGEFCTTVGMIIFSVNFSGVIMPVTNGLHDPSKFKPPLLTALIIICLTVAMQASFGYNAYIKESEAPITVNFPMTLAPQILKVLIMLMVYVTHALNFWAPFNLNFFYIRRAVKDQTKHVMYEYICRIIICFCISLFAIAFPDVDALIGFIGCLCLSNMGLIWPNLIYLLVVSARPGFGKYKWRLWRGLICIVFGLFIMICGGYVTGEKLFKSF